MPLLFSYGTLQHPDVQHATFGRALHGHADALPGYAPALVRITDNEQIIGTIATRQHLAEEPKCLCPHVLGFIHDDRSIRQNIPLCFEKEAGVPHGVIPLS